MKRLIKSFKYALQGVRYNFLTQPNFKIHTLCAVLAITLAYILKFSKMEWAVLMIVIFLVIAFEAMNTAIEEAVNCATKGEMTETAKIAKDSAAAGVMIIAFLSLIIAVILYLQKIISLIWG